MLVELQVMETINDRIRIAREKKGLNQSELATAIGVKPQTIQQWEAFKTSPRPTKVDVIASVLEVTSDWLLTGRDPLALQAAENEEALSRKERILLELFRDATDEQQTELIRSLETQKQQNDKLWEQLSKKKVKIAQ